MTYAIVWRLKNEEEIRKDLGIPTPLPLPNPLPVGADIAKNNVFWFEVKDEDADKLQYPLMNWISRSSSNFINEESGAVMGSRNKVQFVQGESNFRKFLSKTLYIVDFTVLAKRTWNVSIRDSLDPDYNCDATMRTYESWIWSPFAVAMGQAKIEGVSFEEASGDTQILN